ncbi:hypothetical protein [Halosegnis sp.]|uniref:hypothetical protein n=1 Tax=Halosegnis sp. TaxID=2864959 RepID=UPI0035D48254
MTEGWDAETVFDLFGEPTTRRVLALASDGPVDADGIVESLNVSRPTVYRDLDELVEYDLLAEREHVDEVGNRYQTYVATLQSVTFSVDDGQIHVDLELAREPGNGAG